MDVPPIPLFAGEHVVGSWPAHYLHRDVGGFRPGTWLARARNRLLGGREDAIEGELHLTTWRLVFSASPGRWHPLSGHFSLFLVRLARVEPGVKVFHQGSKDSLHWSHGFRVERAQAMQDALVACYTEAFRQPKAQRAEFEESARSSWWRAGLGLRARAGVLAGPFSTSGEAEDYRAGSGEEPSFEGLSAQLRGIEGEGLAQLRWLMRPEESAPEECVSLRSGGGLNFDQGSVIFGAPEPIIVPGRPLRVAGEGRASRPVRRKDGW